MFRRPARRPLDADCHPDDKNLKFQYDKDRDTLCLLGSTVALEVILHEIQNRPAGGFQYLPPSDNMGKDALVGPGRKPKRTAAYRRTA